MSTFTTTWNASFDAAPDGSTVAANTLDTVTSTFKQAIRERMAIEHDFVVGDTANQGKHLAGSAKAFYQSAAPTTSPGGDALGSEDAGRVWIDSDDGTVDYWDGSAFQDITTPASTTTQGIIETGSSATIKYTVLNVGDWNMSGSTTSSAISHGLTLSTIRGVSVVLRTDQGNIFGHGLTNTYVYYHGGFHLSTTTITLNTSGAIVVLSGQTLTATSYNRGWITIWYEA